MVYSPSIAAWVASVQHSADLSVPETSTNNDRAKRQRHTDNNSVTSTNADGVSHLAKRRRSELDKKAPSRTPPLRDNIISMSPTGLAAFLHDKRSRVAVNDSANKLSDGEYLRWLEKPVHQTLQVLPSDIPSDVQSLCKDIWSSGFHLEKIIPFELHESVERLSGVQLRSDSCLDPCQEKAAERAAELNILSDIAVQAAVSVQYERHEFGWNTHVHTPVLRHVFKSIPLDTENVLDEPELDEPKPDQPTVTARFESAMSASIATNSIPYIIQAGERVLACSAHSNAQSETSTTSAQTVELRGTQKVDYVVVMNIETDRDLHNVIRNASQFAMNTGGHVNQTAYSSIRYRPIAVSIKTKSTLFDSRDVAELGIWVAAGHKRLYQLRDHLFPPPSPLYIDEVTERPQHPRLVTMPVIRVEGHKWNLYFVCDMKTFIRLLGPIHLGSTENIVKLYALVASLRHIKRWIETTFYDAITTWFTQEAMAPTESATIAVQGHAC